MLYKANTVPLNNFDQLQKEALFTSVSLLMSLPGTLSFILFNVRSLKRHVINIAHDKKLIQHDILFLTKTGLAEDLSALQSILEEYTLNHNVSSFRYSSLAICYKSTDFISFHWKNDGILFFQFFKQTFWKSYQCGMDV